MRFVVFLTVVLSVWVAQHAYVGWRLLSLPAFAGGAGRPALLVGLLLGFLSYPLGRTMWHIGWPRVGLALELVGAVWMGVLLLLLAAFVAVDLVTVGGLVLRPWVAALRAGAAAVALLASVLALAGGLKAPRVVEVEVVVPGLPAAADGLRIVQVSDLHLGTLRGRRLLQTVSHRIEELQPDLIAITGDLVDADGGVVESLVAELRGFRAPLGVFAVLGNHELYAGAERSRRLLRDAGFTILDNAATEVTPGLVVAGVPDAGGSAQTGAAGPDLWMALHGVAPDRAIVLLQHAPGNEREAQELGVDVMLNGHTHGGQIWPFSLLVRIAFPRIAGVHRVGAMTQVISRGAGTWGPPMRLLAPSDVVLVTLRAG